jgi:hypothetical protein
MPKAKESTFGGKGVWVVVVAVVTVTVAVVVVVGREGSESG